MYTCGFCKNTISKGQYSVSCVLCKNFIHLNCASKCNPKVTAIEVETMKSKKGGLVYRCGVCADSPSNVQGDGLQLILEKLAAVEASNKYVAEKITALETNVSDAVRQLTEVTLKVNNCSDRVDKLEKDAGKKFAKLEMENEELRRIINRCDIVIHGLPSSITDAEMRNAVLNIGQKYSNDFSMNDVSFCAFTNRKKAVLLKVSNTGKRDEIMKNYRADFNLKASDVLDLGIHSRIYLNDNYTKLEGKIRYVCRSLQRGKIIQRFRVSYGGGMRVFVFDLDGKEKELCLQKILLFHEKKLSQAELLSDDVLADK